MKNLILIALILGSVACGTSKKSASMAMKTTQIPTGVWTLSEMKDVKNLNEIFKIEKPNFELNAADSTIAGYGGCNRFHGKFVVENGRILENGPLGMTKMLCMDNGEPEFVKLFRTANVMKLEKGKLYLLNENDVLLTFEQK